MSFKRCPGSSSFAQPTPETVACPDCGTEVEVWSDEATGDCPACGKTVIRTATQSCVDWCRFAKECLGDEKFRKYGRMKASMRKPALLAAMADVVGTDGRLIAHNKAMVSYAEMLLAKDGAADPNVVIAAAALHDLGAAGADTTVADILHEMDYAAGFVTAVCALLTQAATGDSDAPDANRRILHDAALLTAHARRRARDTGDLPDAFLDSFDTRAGRSVALEMGRFLSPDALR